MAGLAHLVGLFLAFLIWTMQKGRSRFVRYQAMQAVVFDAITMFLFISLSIILAGATVAMPFLVVMLAELRGELGMRPEWISILPGLMPLSIVVVLIPFFVLWMGVRLWAAFSIFSGRNFHYPVVGILVGAKHPEGREPPPG